MTTAAISLYALAALLGVAPAVLRATLSRAGARLGPKEQATEDDLARAFGREMARELVRKVRSSGRRPRG
jgi:hypothetical protein